jgi:hypothetical protein
MLFTIENLLGGFRHYGYRQFVREKTIRSFCSHVANKSFSQQSLFLNAATEVQIMILNFILSPKSFAPADSTMLADSGSPLNRSGEGILRTSRYFRHLGLEVLFRNQDYTPVYLCVRWRFGLLDLYLHQTYLSKRHNLLSLTEKTLGLPLLGIQYWTQLVLPMRVQWPKINQDLRIVSLIFERMVGLQSLHLTFIILPGQTEIPDWKILLSVLANLPLRRVSLTIHCVLDWIEGLRTRIPALLIRDGPLYLPTVNVRSFCFEAADLSKEAGLRDLGQLLDHITSIYQQYSLGNPIERRQIE